MIETYDWAPDEELLTVLYSLTVSIFAIGGMTGALLVGRLVTKYGRLVCAIVFCVFNICQRMFVFVKSNINILFCVFNRKGTLVRATVLVFIGGALMGFSRACRLPAMVIIGRFITGVHSGKACLIPQ